MNIVHTDAMHNSPHILITFLAEDEYGLIKIIEIKDMNKIPALKEQRTEVWVSKKTIDNEIVYFLTT